MRIFFCGPLTEMHDVEKTKAFYTKLGEVAASCGFDYFWAFQHGTDPVKNPDVTPEFVYKQDIRELEKSDLMIAYIEEPSTGTGIEIEHARLHNIPAYLLYKQGSHVSRMVQGDPVVKREITYTDEQDALSKVKELLEEIKKNPTLLR